jgi:hypothetical protein
MIIAAIIANAILGGIWRRVLGGWFGLRRSYIVAAGFLLTWPFWLALDWYWSAAGSGGMMLFWTMGHRFDSPWIMLRYPVVGAIYPISRLLWASRYTEISEVVIGAFFWGLVTFLVFV